jgi:hypothetical protein
LKKCHLEVSGGGGRSGVVGGGSLCELSSSLGNFFRGVKEGNLVTLS